MAGGINTYVYQNPIKLTDPTGTIAPLVGFCIAGAVGPVGAGAYNGSLSDAVFGGALGCATGVLSGVGAVAGAGVTGVRVVAAIIASLSGSAINGAFIVRKGVLGKNIPDSASVDPVLDSIQDEFCRQNPNAANCQNEERDCD